MERYSITSPMPNDVNLENVVIGAAMMDEISLAIVVEKLTPDDFYSGKCKDLFEVMQTMVNQRRKVDVVSLGTELMLRKRDDLIDTIGDAASTHCFTECVESHVDLLSNLGMLRRLLVASNEISRMAYSYDGENFDGIADKSEGLIRDATSKNVKSKESNMTEIMGETFDRMQKTAQGNLDRIKTGFKTVDSVLGFESPDLVVLAGRPSMGKTAFATSMMLKIAKKAIPIVFFSIEMGKVQLGQRILSQEAEVNLFEMRNNMLSKNQYQKMAQVAGKIADLPIIIDDEPLLSLNKIRSKIRKYISKYGSRMVVVDHLHLMDYDKTNENAALSVITRGLKITAKDFGIPIWLLCQLSRDATKRATKNARPVLSDLRGSGAIEQDADAVLFVHRQSYYDKEFSKEDAEIIIAKQRNGPIDSVHVGYNPSCATFLDIDLGEAF
jgi:replicative DNA helicase